MNSNLSLEEIENSLNARCNQIQKTIGVIGKKENFYYILLNRYLLPHRRYES